MKRPNQANGNTAGAADRGPPDIAFSITNERGENFSCRARGVSFRFTRGIVQMVEEKRGCFVCFDDCLVELRDGHRNVCYQLHTGSVSSDGTDVTIVAEVGGDIGGRVKPERSRAPVPQRPINGCATNVKTLGRPWR